MMELLDDSLTAEERDLELAAQIGQSLLEQNKYLKIRNEELEVELTSANDTITQLRHEISTKNQLIQIYSADLETNETEPESIDESCSSSRDRDRPQVNWELIQEKINHLENENIKLRSEASRRTMDIEAEEKKELLLIHDCAKQLIDANLQLINLQEELARRAEDNVHQHEEITNLLTQVVELQKKIRELSIENEGLHSALDLAHDCQNVLSAELLEMKDKYNVLMTAFQELQDEMKRKSEMNLSNWPPPHGSFMPFCDSLAAELEDSMESDGYESGLSSLNRLNHRRDADETRSHSPDSVLGGSGALHRSGLKHFGPNHSHGHYFPGRSFQFSNKLRIVKPMEGSAILNKWKKMATPHLGAIFESTSGVQSKIIENIRTDLSKHASATAAAAAAVAAATAAVSSIATSSSPTSSSSSTASALNGSSSEAKSTKDEELESNNPGKLFDTTLSTYTFTTTSLSLTKESTLVTPSFSSVQLSAGHILPITTTSVSFSSTHHGIPKKNSADSTENPAIASCTVSYAEIVSNSSSSTLSSSISHQPVVSSSSPTISVLFQDLLRNKCSNYVKYLSGALAAIELSPVEIIPSSDLARPDQVFQDSNNSPSSSQAHNGLNYLAKAGDDGLSAAILLADTCDKGVITKGSTINPASIKSIGETTADIPNQRCSVVDLNRVIYSGKILPLKTLRKGGLV